MNFNPIAFQALCNLKYAQAASPDATRPLVTLYNPPPEPSEPYRTIRILHYRAYMHVTLPHVAQTSDTLEGWIYEAVLHVAKAFKDLLLSNGFRTLMYEKAYPQRMKYATKLYEENSKNNLKNFVTNAAIEIREMSLLTDDIVKDDAQNIIRKFSEEKC